jgi:hypothetical protein
MAVTRVNTQDIKDDAVRTTDIQAAAVTYPKLDVATDPALESDGSDKIRVKVDNTTIERSASGLQVKDDGIGADEMGIITTKGDLLGYSTQPLRIPVGTDTHVLTADSSLAAGVKWAAAAGGGSSPTTTKGDLAGYDTASARIPVGSNDQILYADSTDAQGVAWNEFHLPVKSADPGTPIEGQTWLESTLQVPKVYVAGHTSSIQRAVLPPIVDSTALLGSGPANQSFDNTLWSTPAGFFKPGRMIKASAWGKLSTAGIAASIVFRVQPSPQSNMFNTPTIPIASGLTDAPWRVDFWLICRVPAGGVVNGGLISAYVNSNVTPYHGVVPAIMSIAGAVTWQFRIQWITGGATISITCTGCIWETVY